MDDIIAPLEEPIGEVLLKPTIIYTHTILELMKNVELKGVANITGGGFIENIPRTLPKNLSAEIMMGSWDVQPVFELAQKLSQLEDEEIYNTLNMGIGMVLVVDPTQVEKTLEIIEESGEKGYLIGSIVEGDEGVILC